MGKPKKKFINLIHIFQTSLLFLCLIKLINAATIEYIIYNADDKSATYKHTSGTITKCLELDFNSMEEIPPYIKVTITPNENTPTPILCFSPEDSYCNYNRQILSKKTDGLSSMIYIKREQYYYDLDKLFVFITCEESGCEYTIKFEGSNYAEIDVNSVFSYLVTINNKEMRFKAIGVANEGSFLTIGVEGSSSVQLVIDDIDNYQYIFDTGKIITFPIVNTNSNSLAYFVIKNPNIGEFLTINIHIVYKNEAKDNLLYPNGPTIMGLLSREKGYFTEECFPISAFATGKYSNVNKFYLTGRIHSKYATFWLADENNNFMESTEVQIKDGLLSYMIETNGKKRSVCFEFSYAEEIYNYYAAYSISILETTKMENIYNFYFPQIIGENYRRIIPKGNYAVYHPGKLYQYDIKLYYYMYNRKGVAEMYTYKCLSYPYCNYSIEEIQKFNKTKKINKMAIYDFKIDKTYEALDKEKQVMIVYCKDDDNENDGFCEVDVSFSVLGKKIKLIENEQLSNYVLKNDIREFIIDCSGGILNRSLIIDIMVYSGDVTFNIKSYDDILKDDKITHLKYYLSNKIVHRFYFAEFPDNNMEINSVAQINSFFTIKYRFEKISAQIDENIISGENYLVEIDPTTIEKTKTVYFSNNRTKKEQPFFVNFFALNCEFQVTRKEKDSSEKEITIFNGYAQEVIFKNNEIYNSGKYPYKIKILEPEISNYNYKMCMLYISGYESPDTDFLTEIVVGENMNQKVIFSKDFKTIRFLYPHADPEKDLLVYVNIIDQAYYNVKIYLNSDDYSFKQYNITRSQIFNISSTEILSNYSKDNLCNIIIEVEFIKNITDVTLTEQPKIEVNIRPIKSSPSYLKKGYIKKDFTYGDNFYYLYTDIGKYDIGEILLYYPRNLGNVLGRIVRKDQIYSDEEANWKGIYRMPSVDWEDSLPFNRYTKKLEITFEDTVECINGCYLLISIQTYQIQEYVENFKFYPFSIIAKIMPNNFGYTDIPRITIQVNQYIIGNVDLVQKEKYSNFYEVLLPYDSYKVEFDFQSEVAGLYINLEGGALPTYRSSDFVYFPPGRDSIFSLDKNSIIEKAISKKINIPHKDSLKDLKLIIGIWTDKLDSVETELFSLNVRLPNDNLYRNIIEVNTDQKILCNPTILIGGLFRCLFMITYDDEDEYINIPLFVHAASVNRTAVTHIYANFIEKKYYDEYDVDILRTNIPTLETAQYTIKKENIDYIYINLNSFNKYLYVNVESDKNGEIFILASKTILFDNDSYKGNYPFYPNPSSEQLLSVSRDNLRLGFFTGSSILVNIVTLGGEAIIKWSDAQNNFYNLKERGDRLTLVSKVNNELIIENKISSNNTINSSENPGFVFYISYYTRNSENNFDKIEGNFAKIVYKKSDFPIFLYNKIGYCYNDINTAITLKYLDINKSGQYISAPFVIKLGIFKEVTIYKIKSDPELFPNQYLIGAYDPIFKTAQFFFSRDLFKSLNIKPEENPTILISIEKSNSYMNQEFGNISIITEINQNNDNAIPLENIYHYGKVDNEYITSYRLRTNKDKKKNDYRNFF